MTNVRHWPAAQLDREQMNWLSEKLEEWGWAHDIVIDARNDSAGNGVVASRRIVIRKPRIRQDKLRNLQALADEYGVSIVFNQRHLEFR